MCNIFFYIVSFRLNTSCFFLQKLSKLKVYAKLAPVNALKSCRVILKVTNINILLNNNLSTHHHERCYVNDNSLSY